MLVPARRLGNGHAAVEVVRDAGSGLDETRPKLYLERDMTGVLIPVGARLYGRRGARNRAMRAVTAAGHETAGACG